MKVEVVHPKNGDGGWEEGDYLAQMAEKIGKRMEREGRRGRREEREEEEREERSLGTKMDGEEEDDDG